MLVGHHNLPDVVPWAVSMVRMTFADELGNSRTTNGTGFWLSTADGHRIYATNRHVVDASLAYHDDETLKKLRITRTEVHVRRGDDTSLMYEPGSFFEVREPRWLLHESADVAILVDPKIHGASDANGYKVYCLPESFLADGAWINTQLRMMDECYFVGYPSVMAADGETVVRFYDVPANFPIARQAIIASGPFYTHKDIKTAGVMLVSGLSFHGSSGSPVITPLLGMPPGSVKTFDPDAWANGQIVAEHREPRLIGIMTGKLETREIDGVFIHAGLSYFTRAGYIVELIRNARESGWKREPAESRPADE